MTNSRNVTGNDTLLGIAAHSLLGSVSVIKIGVDTVANDDGKTLSVVNMVEMMKMTQYHVDFVADTLMDFAHGLPEEVKEVFAEERRRIHGHLRIVR